MSPNRFAIMLILSFVLVGIGAAAINRPNILKLCSSLRVAYPDVEFKQGNATYFEGDKRCDI